MTGQVLNKSIAQVCNADGKSFGTACLIGEGLVITCAHVVNVALGYDEADQPCPQEPVYLKFPEFPMYGLLATEVTFWSPPSADWGDANRDIAGLKLTNLPADMSGVYLEDRDIEGHHFHVTGFPMAGPDQAEGTIIAKLPGGLVQLKTQDVPIEEGFSGAPVWDDELEDIVGMVVIVRDIKQANIAWMIPTAVLTKQWPDLKKYIAQYIFISCVSEDTEFATRLQADLKHFGIKTSPKPKDLAVSSLDRDKVVHNAIRSSRSVLVLVSPNSYQSRSVSNEINIAKSIYGRPIHLIWIAGETLQDVIPSEWTEMKVFDARAGLYDEMLPQISQMITAEADRSLVQESIANISTLPEPRNPYKGLNAFTSEDAGDFFGREKLINDLVVTMSQPPGQRFLAIVGPSGSGKSSVVMAGLLPQLQRLSISRSWIYLDSVLPGSDPIESLGVSLLKQIPAASLKGIREDLENSSRGLLTTANRIITSQTPRVVIFIDQFEELFTQTVDLKLQSHFIDLLVTATTEVRSPVIVILTLRADFFDRTMEYGALGKLLETHSRFVLPLEVADLRNVIEKPAKLPDVQMGFEKDLVGDLLIGISNEPGQLPLLQFTLYQLVERCKANGNLLTIDAYRIIGGVRGALAKHAEEIYSTLPSDEHRALAKRLFLRLLEIGFIEQDNVTRRRALLTELDLSDEEKTKIIHETANIFVDKRLLTTNKIGDSTTVEISHEALIKEWERLNNWLADARGKLRIQKAVTVAAAEWVRRGRPIQDDTFYYGTELKSAQDWAKDAYPSIDEAAFIATSEKAEKQREDLRKNQASQTKNLKRAVAIFIVVGILAILLTSLAITQANTAQAKVALAGQTLTPLAQKIVDGQQLNESLRLAASANEVMSKGEQNNQTAILLGLSALQQAYSPQADLVLAKTMSRPYIYSLTTLFDKVGSAAISSDNQLVLIGSGGSGQAQASLWDLNTGKHLQTFAGHKYSITSVAFSPDKKHVLTGSADGTARLWNISTGKAERTLVQNTNFSPVIARFSPDGRVILTSIEDTTIQWDVNTGEEVRRTTYASEATDILFSPDGLTLLYAFANGQVSLLNASTFKEIRSFVTMDNQTKSNTASQIGFSADGRQVFIGQSKDQHLHVFDRETGKEIKVLKYDFDFNTLAFAQNGKVLALSDSAHAELLDIGDGTRLTVALPPGDHDVVAISPNAQVALLQNTKYLENSSQGVSVNVIKVSRPPRRLIVDSYDPKENSSLEQNPNTVNLLEISPDGGIFLTSSLPNREIGLWDTQTSIKLRTLSLAANVSTIMYSPDGNSVIVLADNRAYLIDPRSGRQLRVFSGYISGLIDATFSPDGKLLLTGSNDGIVQLWDVNIGKVTRTFARLQSYVWQVAFSPDGKLALTSSADGIVRIWESGTGNLVSTLGMTRHNYERAIFSPDGKKILVIGETPDNNPNARVLSLWQASTGQLLRAFVVQGATTAAFSPDGQNILTSGTQVQVLETGSGKILHLLLDTTTSKSSSRAYYVLAGRSILTQDNKNVSMWDAASGQPLRSFPISPSASISIFPNSTEFLSVDTQEIVIWNVAEGAKIKTIALSSLNIPNDTLSQQTVAPNNQTMLLYDSHEGYLVDAQTGSLSQSFSWHSTAFLSAAFAPDGKTVVTGNNDTKAYLWNVQTGEELRVFAGHVHDVTSVAFTPDGKFIITGSRDRTAVLWNVQSGQQQVVFSGHTDSVTDLTITPDGKMLVTGSTDGTARIWEIKDGKLVRVIKNQTGVTAVALSPNGQTVATGGTDGIIRLWNLQTGQFLRLFSSHKDNVLTIAFSADGEMVMSASADNSVRLWDAESGQEKRLFSEYTGSIASSLLTPDGKFVLIGGANGNVHWWNVDFRDFITYGCSLVMRDFTAEERGQFGIFSQEPTCPEFSNTPRPTRTLSLLQPLPPTSTHFVVEPQPTAAEASDSSTAIAQLKATQTKAGNDMERLSQQAVRIFGPEKGQLSHSASKYLEVYNTPVNPSNYIIDIKFHNPYDSTKGAWDYGFVFNNKDGSEYRLSFHSDRSWKLQSYIGQTWEHFVPEGTLNNFKVAAGEANEIRLVVDGKNTSQLYVNGVLVNDFEFSFGKPGNWISLATGFNSKIPGQQVPYEKFSIWSLDPIPTLVPVRADVLAEAANASHQAIRVSGPASGYLKYTTNGPTRAERAYVSLTNLIAEARFFNPFEQFKGNWDYGLVFRIVDNSVLYRVFVNSNRSWKFVLVKIDKDNNWQFTTIAQGLVANLDTSKNGSNTLQLVIQNKSALFFVNKDFVSQLDVSTHMAPGAVEASVGLERSDVESSTYFDNFRVWALAPFPTSTPTISPTSTLGSLQIQQLTATAQEQISSVEKLVMRGRPIYTLDKGELKHTNDEKIDRKMLASNLTNFVAEVRFFNPFAVTFNNWDYGIGFWQTSSSDFRLVFQENGKWKFKKLGNNQDDTIANGTIPNFDARSQGSNKIQLTVNEGKMILFVNDQYISTWSVPTQTFPTDLWVGTGFYTLDKVPGYSTRFDSVKIWSLDSFPTPVPSPTGLSSLMPGISNQAVMIGLERSGALVHTDKDEVETSGAGVNVSDFIVEVTFYNPYDPIKGNWDYGLYFRHTTKGDEYRLYIDANHQWRCILVEDGKFNIIATGYIQNLEGAVGEPNKIRLVAQGDKAYLFVNNIFVTTLDITYKQIAGDVLVGTGFSGISKLVGEKTIYEHFTVWSLDSQPSSTPTLAPTASPQS